ncbi:hypothetical protein NIES2100_73780 [Calothrix sp. NIES-2100]|uniref:hypothetical protein n=1 Tax=Calothrix sp. NIES-2100 TaxID=1954172 RepID=UPI000B611FDA|nr:hypothetical protein NIES2100_73780 [Calothrix sp. NIES-2100]
MCKTFPADAPNWIFFPAGDRSDPISGTLNKCLMYAGIETLEEQKIRYKQAIGFGDIYAPDFTNQANDLLFHQYKKQAIANGELEFESGDRIKYSSKLKSA